MLKFQTDEPYLYYIIRQKSYCIYCSTVFRNDLLSIERWRTLRSCENTNLHFCCRVDETDRSVEYKQFTHVNLNRYSCMSIMKITTGVNQSTLHQPNPKPSALILYTVEICQSTGINPSVLKINQP